LPTSDFPHDGLDDEDEGAEEPLGGGDGPKRVGPGPAAERAWVHPSEFRRFVDLNAPARAPQLTAADQTRRAAITAAAMAFFITGLLLLNLKPIEASTTTSTTSPVAIQLDVAVVSVEMGSTTTIPSLLGAGPTVDATPTNDGAMVTAVLPHSPAGSILRRGDIITRCDSLAVHSVADLNQCTTTAGSDQVVCLHLARHGAAVVANVRLGREP
jgi:hypothetical protein